ncbi:MAG: hypothetical protein R3C61_10385 [Bacteroidia bacterium]
MTVSRSRILFRLYIILLILPCLEVALWILGFRPFRQVNYSIRSAPEGCLIADSTLGFALQPGAFDVTINEGLTYHAVHGNDSLRIAMYQKNHGPFVDSIYFTGCSFTYGMGVDDSLTFAFRAGELLPGSLVKNMGIPGFGTIQSYIQLKRLIAKGETPGKFVVGYAAFHNVRNALTPSYRRDLYMGYRRADPSVGVLMQGARIPFMVEGGNEIHFCRWEDIYKNWPYREVFASVNYAQELRDRYLENKTDTRAVTLHIFDLIGQLCLENHIRLIVAGISPDRDTRDMLKLLSSKGLETVDIAPDLTLEKYRNFPWDDHPGPLAHAWYAARLAGYLSE